MNSSVPLSHEPVSPRELSLVALGLAVAIGLLALLGGSVLWTRPLWLDEICCTYYVVRDAGSPLDVIRNVAQSKDYAPPLLHLVVWSVGRVAGGVTPVVLRSISLACVSLALLFVYATLRRRFDRAPSSAGALAVASHGLVLAHAFEGRFYGPWLLFAAGFAWSLGVQSRRRRDLGIAAFSIAVCTIHWFGVLSLGLMSAAAFATRGRRWRAGARLIAPAAVGLLALVPFLPWAFSERSGAGDYLWVPPLSGAQVGAILKLFFLSTAPVLALILLLVDGLRDDVTQPSVATNIRDALRDPSLAALTSLAAMPFVLMLISVVLQPSLLDRYAILTVLAWAPLVALAVQSLGRGARVALVLFVGVLVGVSLHRTIAEKRGFARVVRDNAAAFEQAKTMGLPIVFQSLHTIYPVGGVRHDRTPLFLVVPDSTISRMIPQPRLEWLRRSLRVERNIARSHERVYGFPSTVTQAQLDSTPRFLLVASDESLPRLYKQVELFTSKVFPRHRVKRLSANLTLLER